MTPIYCATYYINVTFITVLTCWIVLLQQKEKFSFLLKNNRKDPVLIVGGGIFISKVQHKLPQADCYVSFNVISNVDML